MKIRLILAAMLVAAPAPALAWGEYAHRLIGSIAKAELTPAARAEVNRILAKSRAVDTPACPMATLEDAAVWPDCIRGEHGRFASTFSWHYQNIDVCKSFDADANCADGNCVTGQIPRQLAIVADRKASPAARAEALAFVIHLVGDMHQPLHIGEKKDKGGNDVRAAYGAKAPGRMNLHRIWDGELAERALTEPPAITATSPTKAQRREYAKGTIADWARESWELSRTIVYPQLRDYPDTCPAKSEIRAVIDAPYIAAATPAVREQVERAGVRAAMLLNKALAR